MLSRSYPRQWILLTVLLSYALILLPTCDGGRSFTIISGIFGFGNDNGHENGNASGNEDPPPTSFSNQQQSFGRSASASLPPHLRNREPTYPNANLPPPPPPPLLQREAANKTMEQVNYPPPPPPPPLPQWGMNPQQQQQQLQQAHQYQQQQQQQQVQQQLADDQQGWMQPPPYEDQWDYYGDQQDYIKVELDESLAREGDLIAQLDNLTAAVVVMEQREELHMRQLDVLTERVMDVEAQAASDRNLMISYQANCTELGKSVAALQNELDTWQQRCSEFAERHDADQQKIHELKRRIKDKESEMEDLAIAIENVRLAEKRREASQSRRKSNRGGVMSWVLSFFVSNNGDYDESMREEAYEMAKSTLLRALQVERGNVHELEAAVMSLQQNNSAISEMVESRDSIIDELNNRIAVFEEDKVVLKAALRQLQKEIKDEAPKAQKLMDDLAKAEQELKRLKSEMNGIIQTHQQEILNLQQTISSKQQAISETESNLTAIGTYVDRLEERLTSFAVTRRDMEEREKKCKEIEEAALVTEKERMVLQEQVEEFTKREDEVKKVLEELAVERATLQKENRKLYTEREFRIAEQEQLQAKCASLENATKVLQDEVENWKSKTDNILPELEALQSENKELRSKLELLGEIQQELESTRQRCETLEADWKKANDDLELEKLDRQRVEELTRNQSMKLADFEKKFLMVEKELQKFSPKDQDERRSVPFRKLRKELSKVTGVHGLITPPSQKKRTEQHRDKSPMPNEGQQIVPPPPPQRDTPPVPPESS